MDQPLSTFLFTSCFPVISMQLIFALLFRGITDNDFHFLLEVAAKYMDLFKERATWLK